MSDRKLREAYRRELMALKPKLRKKRFSHRMVAEMAGLTRETVSLLLSGTNLPSVKSGRAIVEACNKLFSYQREEEDIKIIQGMLNYGGSFVRALGQSLLCADNVNYAKLKSIFANYFVEYKNFK